MLSMWNHCLNSDRFLPFIKYWYKLSFRKPLQPHIPHPKNHLKAFKHYITLKLFFLLFLRWWNLYGLSFRVSDHRICLPNHLRWARKLLPSATVQDKYGQPLTITILPYYKMWCVTNLRLCAIKLQLEVSEAVYGCPSASPVKQHHWQTVKHANWVQTAAEDSSADGCGQYSLKNKKLPKGPDSLMH